MTRIESTKWENDTPPALRSQIGGEAHGNFKGTENKPLYLGGKRGEEIASQGAL